MGLTMTTNRQHASPLFAGIIALAVAVAGVAIVLTIRIVTEPSHRPRLASDNESASLTSPDIPVTGPSAASGAEHQTPSFKTYDSERQRAERKRQISTLLDGLRLRLLNLGAQSGGMGIETIGNSMAPYIQGALATLRALNPGGIDDLRDDLATRACDHPQTDSEDMLTAQMVLTDANLGSPMIFDCVLGKRKQEDVVMWTMLDAWKAAGRPQVASITDIAAAATDPRTIRRLTANDPVELARLAGPPNGATATNITPTSTTITRR
jgi:hypothetical protein